MKGDMACGHNPYWRTVYDNCMACRAEQAEKKLADLTAPGGLVERCRHTIDQLQEHLGPGSLMKADAQTLLTDLEALK